MFRLFLVIAFAATAWSLEPFSGFGAIAQAQSFCVNIRGIGGCVRTKSRRKSRKYYNRRKSVRQKSSRKRSGRRSSRARYSRADTRTIQAALTVIGLNPGPIDGAIGRKTRAAVRAFQRALGDPETGSLTATQATKLYTVAKAVIDEEEKGPKKPKSTENAFSAEESARFRPIAKINVGPKSGIKSSNEAPALTGEIAAFCRQHEVRIANVGEETLAFRNSVRLLPIEFCSTFQHLAAAGRAMSETDICAAYADQSKIILADALSLPIEEFALSLSARYGAETVRADHRKNGETCLLHSLAESDLTDSYFFSALLYGTGNAGFSEFLGQQTALGIGIKADLQRAKYWMDQATRSVSAGAAPLVEEEGVDRAEMLASMSAEIETLIKEGADYTPLEPTSSNYAVFEAPGPKQEARSENRDASDIARAVLALQYGEAVRSEQTYSELYGELDTQMRDECLDVAGTAIKAGPDNVAGVLQDNFGSGNLVVPGLQFCRTAAYLADNDDAMFVYDYGLQAVLGSGNATMIAAHYVLGTGVEVNHEYARNWLKIASAEENDAYLAEQISDLSASISAKQ